MEANDDDTLFVTPDVDVNAVKSSLEASALAAPLYGKLNLFDQMILYTDIYFGLGLARVDTEQGVKSAITFAGGQRFYFSESFSVRVDIRNRRLQETRGGKDEERNSLAVDIGASYLFGSLD